MPTAVAAAVVVAGCGAQPSVSTRPPASRAAVHPVSAPANRDRAEREAARLLALAELPPKARRQATPPERLSAPFQHPAVSSLVDRSAYWRVPMTFDAALAWVRAHPPAGLRHDGSMRSGGRGYRLAGDTYASSSPPGVRSASLQVQLASLDDGATGIRVDALAIWLDPDPLRDRVPGPRLRITVAGGCPKSATRSVGVRSSGADLATALLPAGRPSAALLCRYSGLNGHPASGLVTERRLDVATTAEVVRQIRQLDLSHPTDGVTSCPFDDGSVIALALSYPDRPDVDIWYVPRGCPRIGNGVISGDAWPLGDALWVAAGLPN